MRIFIGKWFVFILLFSLFNLPSDPYAAENITRGQIVPTSLAAPAEQPPANPQSKDSKDLPRSDFVEFLFGSFLLFLGLTTIVLSLFRWKADDLPLIFFGIFGFERRKTFIKTHSGHPADDFADAFITHLFNWSGKRSEKALDDDLILIVVDYQHG
jgi:hypothetical protein